MTQKCSTDRSRILQTVSLIAIASAMLSLQAVGQPISDKLPVLDLDKPIRMNFSGNWEKDFARSDKWEDELSRRMSIRQGNAALQRSGIGLRGGPSISLGNISLNRPRRRQANLIDLARLSEYMNRFRLSKFFKIVMRFVSNEKVKPRSFVPWKPGLQKFFRANMARKSAGGTASSLFSR